jgi:predicted aconitase with swiveling domain
MVPEARALAAGRARGEALVLSEPLSFWGGVDPATGLIVDRLHPQAGADTRGKILVMPAGRGSSSSSSVLAEAIRSGTGPAGILLFEPDHMLALGALMASELYGLNVPVVVIEERLGSLRDGLVLTVEADADSGTARVSWQGQEP